jgi:matrixin
MSVRAIVALCGALAFTPACGGSSPSSPSNGSGVLEGRTVSAIDGGAAGGVALEVGFKSTTADNDGYFRVDVGKPSTFDLRARGSGIVERQSAVLGPGAEPIRVSLIPMSFDLSAFDQMFRHNNGQLQRWTVKPSLVVLGSVMTYFSGERDGYPATSEQLSDEEIEQLVGHVTEGLGILTAGTFTGFQSVEIERPATGTQASVNRSGKIVVGRYNRIVTHANTIGFGQWALGSDGSVRGGAMFLDSDFDKNDKRRRLLRIHELGHALGMMHVTDRPSIMNPALGPDVTDFDRGAASIAFDRPIGNKAPDVDPARVPAIRADDGHLVWAPPVYCR